MGYLGVDNGSNVAFGITTDTTNFNHILSVADDTVQKALDTIDDTGGSITDHGSLAGLSDDDHPQYTTDNEAITYALIFG